MTRGDRVSLWQHGDFRRFWVGETVSLFGTQITALALPLTAILLLNSSATQVGLLKLAQLLPYLLLSLVFGAIADGRPRRSLMIGANGLRFVLIGAIPVLAVVNALDLGWLYGITFASGVAAVMFDVCWVSYVPTIVPDRGYLVEANSKLGVSAATADIAGPGLAGALVGILTAPVALAVDAVSYLISIVSLLRIRTVEPPNRSANVRRHLPAEIVEGVRWVFGNELLRPMALIGACFNFFLLYVETVFLVYAVRDLHLGPMLIGVVLSGGAVGALTGAVSANSVIRRFGVGPVYGACMITGFGSWLIIPLAGGPKPLLVGVLVFAFLLNATALGTTNIVVVSLRQAITPTRLMARMNAVMRMLLLGVGALGGPVGGLLAGWLGLRPALWLGTCAAVVALVVCFPRRVVRLRDLPTSPDGSPPGDVAVATGHQAAQPDAI